MFFLIYFMCVTIHESVYVREVGRVGGGKGGGGCRTIQGEVFGWGRVGGERGGVARKWVGKLV